MPLKGLSGDVVRPVGTITLSVLAGKASKAATIMVDFLIVKALSSYNAILGHPNLNNRKAITSTYHLKMKLSTTVGVGKVWGEQVLAQECYVQEFKIRGGDIRMTKGPTYGEEPPPPPLPVFIDKGE
ncbi:uncharacterized protein LOC121236610 [Juglans microcarpa x Juglans regia]|uniref:uncharacterized protein LOC121236610 n=1 Tax=Juglans microcarpa x Juglans regia TaxID=2249226 RepID=UPI001B7DD1DB|nr:uncharacterized protein LOC121236610 [Juglans microcarpa x Juglans regia]